MEVFRFNLLSIFSKTSKHVLSNYLLKMILNSECLTAPRMVLIPLLYPFLPRSLIWLWIRDVIMGVTSVRKKTESPKAGSEVKRKAQSGQLLQSFTAEQKSEAQSMRCCKCVQTAK